MVFGKECRNRMLLCISGIVMLMFGCSGVCYVVLSFLIVFLLILVSGENFWLLFEWF